MSVKGLENAFVGTLTAGALNLILPESGGERNRTIEDNAYHGLPKDTEALLDKKGEGDIIERGCKKNIFDSDKNGIAPNKKPIRVLNYQPTSGTKIEATPGKTTTILGRYASDMAAIIDELGLEKSTDFGPRDDGFNLLNVPDDLYISAEQFWEEYNKPWLDAAIKRGDVFKIATLPIHENLYRINLETGKEELSGFGREFMYLTQECSYVYSQRLGELRRKNRRKNL